jgi:hypothetical protein
LDGSWLYQLLSTSVSGLFNMWFFCLNILNGYSLSLIMPRCLNKQIYNTKEKKCLSWTCQLLSVKAWKILPYVILWCHYNGWVNGNFAKITIIFSARECSRICFICYLCLLIMSITYIWFIPDGNETRSSICSIAVKVCLCVGFICIVIIYKLSKLI